MSMMMYVHEQHSMSSITRAASRKQHMLCQNALLLLSTHTPQPPQKTPTLHFALVVDNDTSIVLKVDECTILPPPWLALSDHHGRHHCGWVWRTRLAAVDGNAYDMCNHPLFHKQPTFLAQIRLALFHCRHHHVTACRGWQAVEPSTPAHNGHDVQVLCTSVVSAVHDCSHWQTEGHPELVTGRTTLSFGRHPVNANQWWCMMVNDGCCLLLLLAMHCCCAHT